MERLKFSVWFPFPLIGILVWLATNGITDRVLNQTYQPTTHLNTGIYPRIQITLAPTVSSMVASVDQDDGITEVTFTVANSSLKRLEFEFPIDNLTQVETALIQELQLQRETVQQLIQYHDAKQLPDMNRENAKQK